MIIGPDPWLISGQGHLLPQPLIENLRDIGLSKVTHIASPTNSTIWRQGWIFFEELGLEEEFIEEWSIYMNPLIASHIRFPDREELIWIIFSTRTYPRNLGYISLMVFIVLTEFKWWWKAMWKTKCP